jgi:hypothetical protein
MPGSLEVNDPPRNGLGAGGKGCQGPAPRPKMRAAYLPCTRTFEKPFI